MKITTDKVLEAYIQTRTKIKELEDQIAELKALQTKKEEWLLSKLDEEGETSKKTPHGTVYVKFSESVTVADKDVFFNWVKDNEAWNFMEVRSAKAEVLNAVGDREDNGRPNQPPPGINYAAIRNVGVRKGA